MLVTWHDMESAFFRIQLYQSNANHTSLASLGSATWLGGIKKKYLGTKTKDINAVSLDATIKSDD